jgi:hypothetical protein
MDGKDYHLRKKLPQNFRVAAAQTIVKSGGDIFLARREIIIIAIYFR